MSLQLVGLFAAVAAVLVDSAVTVAMARRILAAAERESTRAAESVRPALNAAVASAIEQAVPLLLPAVLERLGAHPTAETAEGTPGG